MTTPKVTKERFSTVNPNLQIGWNSSSLDPLKTCPRKYQLQILEGWKRKGGKSSLAFGGHYHKALEIYDKELIKGTPYDQALYAAVRYCLALGERTEDGRFIPWTTEEPERNRYTLTRAVVWYADKFRDDPAKTVQLKNGEAAVEVQFTIGTETYNEHGEEFYFFGTLDKIVTFGDDGFVQDRKTTKGQLNHAYFAQYNPNNQMSLYNLAASILGFSNLKGIIIDAVQLGVGFARHARAFTFRTKALLQEWYEDSIRWIRQAERYAAEGHWPMNDTACHHYGGCQFRGICSMDPEVRKLYLASDFEQKLLPEEKIEE